MNGSVWAEAGLSGHSATDNVADESSIDDKHPMKHLISRYRAYLIGKATLRSGLGLVNEAGYQGSLWLVLPLAVAGVCWLTGASLSLQHLTIGLAVTVAVIGYAVVVWEFFVVPLRNDVRRAQGKSPDELE